MSRTLIRTSFLSVCASKFLCLRKQNWCDLGTQGHVHDDFGQIIYQSANARLLDRGIYEYSKEPLHAKKKYHNFPYDRDFLKFIMCENLNVRSLGINIWSYSNLKLFFENLDKPKFNKRIKYK